MTLYKILLFAVMSSVPFRTNSAEAPPAVLWEIKSVSVSDSEKILQFKAILGSGWHLYSQHLNEGGPIPTHFKFEDNEYYRLVGTPREVGDQTRFYDRIFEMEIIMYDREVSFFQEISLEKSGIIKGVIEYMTCNENVCLPGKEAFSIFVKLR